MDKHIIELKKLERKKRLEQFFKGDKTIEKLRGDYSPMERFTPSKYNKGEIAFEFDQSTYKESAPKKSRIQVLTLK